MSRGTTMKIFSISDLAKIAGSKESTVRDWLKHEILRPSIRPQSGRGREVIFDFRDAAITGVVGSLRRVGLPLETLKLVSVELYRADWDKASRFLVIGNNRVSFVDDPTPFFRKSALGEPWTVLDFQTAIDRFRRLVAGNSLRLQPSLN